MGVLNAPPGGDLDFSATIRCRTETPQDDGGVDVGFSNIATGVRVKIRSVRGRELELAQQIHADATYKLTFRYQSAFAGVLDANCQAVMKSRTFEFVSPPTNAGERNRFVDVFAREVT